MCVFVCVCVCVCVCVVFCFGLVEIPRFADSVSYCILISDQLSTFYVQIGLMQNRRQGFELR